MAAEMRLPYATVDTDDASPSTPLLLLGTKGFRSARTRNLKNFSIVLSICPDLHRSLQLFWECYFAPGLAVAFCLLTRKAGECSACCSLTLRFDAGHCVSSGSTAFELVPR